jgi:hypothetical protein
VVFGAWQIPELLILTGSAAKTPVETRRKVLSRTTVIDFIITTLA